MVYGDSKSNPQSKSSKRRKYDTQERTSRGKSAARGAGESARHRLTPRTDSGYRPCRKSVYAILEISTSWRLPLSSLLSEAERLPTNCKFWADLQVQDILGLLRIIDHGG